MDESTDESQFVTFSESNNNKLVKRSTLKDRNSKIKQGMKIQKSYCKLESLKRQQSLQRLIINLNRTSNCENIEFEGEQVQIVDHDIELKSYLMGEKIFKDSNQPITNFLNQNSTQNSPSQLNYKIPTQLNYKIPTLKHKKQKSKSQINNKSNPYQKDSLFSRLHSIDKNQFPLKENRNFQTQNHQQLSFKRNKTLQYLHINDKKYLDLKDIQRKSSIPAGLEIQLVLKKVNQKKQITLNDIVKKLNLPKVKLGNGVNIHKMINDRTKQKLSLKMIQNKNKTAEQIQKQKINEANLTASISRLQQNKIKQLKKLEKQILLSKIKSRQIKQKTNHTIKQNQSKKQLLNLEKFYSILSEIQLIKKISLFQFINHIYLFFLLISNHHVFFILLDLMDQINQYQKYNYYQYLKLLSIIIFKTYLTSLQMSFAQNCLYRFVSAMKNDMVLDISQDTSKSSQLNKAIVFQWNDGPNQKFAIRSVGEGKYAIFCAKNNMVLSPQNAHPEDGTRIVVSKGSKQHHQFWEFVPAYHPQIKDKKGYHIKGFSGKLLDICEQKCKNQQPIIQYTHHGNLNQIWFIQPI